MQNLTNITIKDLVLEYKAFIDSALEKLLQQHDLADYQNSIVQESAKYSVINGGKRLRAILAMISAEAVLKAQTNLKENNPAFLLGLAIELVHSGSLIHDDLPCMDDDDLRRGMAANHKVYGEDNALLAGDFLLLQPLLVLNQLVIPAQEKLDLIKNFNLATQEMILGQSLDLSLAKNNTNDFALTQKMEELKTGALIKLSIVEAAKLAKANAEQLEALSAFAKNLGLAFQIVDDILDETASQEELGKTTGKDLEQNKQTFVKKLGLEEAKKYAQGLIQEAKELLHDKNLFCDKLITVADYVLLRKN